MHSDESAPIPLWLFQEDEVAARIGARIAHWRIFDRWNSRGPYARSARGTRRASANGSARNVCARTVGPFMRWGAPTSRPRHLPAPFFCAPFLRRVVTLVPRWLPIDLYSWNPKDRPGRGVGGEAQAVRAMFRFLSQRYSVAT